MKYFIKLIENFQVFWYVYSQVKFLEVFTIELSLQLTDKETFELKSSCNFITVNKIEVFVVNFYESFLKEETLKFLQHNSNETLINMFTSFMNIIFLYLDDVTLVEEQVEALLLQQPAFKDMIAFEAIFIRAFMKSLQKTLESDLTDSLKQTWLKTVSSFITYIKTQSS